MQYAGVVHHGSRAGRKIGFPTINLDPKILPTETMQGVYASRITTSDSVSYFGALYLGPRLVFDESRIVLEVHIINFDQQIYGQQIFFTLEKFIRPPLSFNTITELKEQIQSDLISIQDALAN